MGTDTGGCKGGLAQLSLESIDVRKERLKTKNWRLQAQILNFPQIRVLWINAYLPTDPQVESWDETDLVCCLSEVESIINVSDCNNILLCGDLNWEMKRKSKFSNVMKSFCGKNDLVSIWHGYEMDLTHIHTDLKSTSTLDNFCCCPD